MAVIYLKHPTHGAKVASTDIEAQHDRENGWVDFDPTVPEVPAFLKPDGGESDLPADFPGRTALVEAGLKWTDLVDKTEAEFLAIKGIGPATAKQIRERLDS